MSSSIDLENNLSSASRRSHANHCGMELKCCSPKRFTLKSFTVYQGLLEKVITWRLWFNLLELEAQGDETFCLKNRKYWNLNLSNLQSHLCINRDFLIQFFLREARLYQFTRWLLLFLWLLLNLVRKFYPQKGSNLAALKTWFLY